ncbi:hypothetical protein LDL49_33515 [Nonomuraea sp. NEAU-L178]|nr:hypothetical protein [Nonomuraea aurantiaca]
MLQTRSEELVARRADIAQLGDACEALRQWLRAMEDYFSAFSGLPEPLVAAARAQEPDNPLTLPCDTLIAATDEYVRAAQLAGRVRPAVTGYDLFLATVSVAWTKSTGLGGQRHAVLYGPGQLGEPDPDGDPDVPRRRTPDQVRDQELSTQPRIGPCFGPPKDLVALCSEAIVIPVPDHRPCM